MLLLSPVMSVENDFLNGFGLLFQLIGYEPMVFGLAKYGK